MRKYLPILFVLSLTLNNFIFAQDSEEETEISSVEALLMLVKEGKTKEQSENADREAKFLANKNKLAIQYASEALINSAQYVPYAAWTAGLSSWRLERYEDSANYFSLFSISLNDDAWHQTSGSFWTARSYAKLGRYDDINFWLKRASNNPNSFYGMLALDADNGKVWAGKDGTWFNSGDPVNGTNAMFDSLDNQYGWIFGVFGENSTTYVNFGNGAFNATQLTGTTYTDSNSQGTFKYQPPTNFLALCTKNLNV